MRLLKLITSFLGQTIMWMLVGVIVIIAAPIFAFINVRSQMGLRLQIKEVLDTVNRTARSKNEDERAQMDGDEMIRRLQEGGE